MKRFFMLLALFITVFALAACELSDQLLGERLDEDTETPEETDDPSVLDWEQQLALLSEEETFFVYVYLSQCSACFQIADDVDDFDVGNAMDIKLVRVSFDEGGTAHEIPFPAEYLYVPIIHVLHEGNVVRTEIGVHPILELFEEVDSGTFNLDGSDTVKDNNDEHIVNEILARAFNDIQKQDSLHIEVELSNFTGSLDGTLTIKKTITESIWKVSWFLEDSGGRIEYFILENEVWKTCVGFYEKQGEEPKDFSCYDFDGTPMAVYLEGTFWNFNLYQAEWFTYHPENDIYRIKEKHIGSGLGDFFPIDYEEYDVIEKILSMEVVLEEKLLLVDIELAVEGAPANLNWAEKAVIRFDYRGGFDIDLPDFKLVDPWEGYQFYVMGQFSTWAHDETNEMEAITIDDERVSSILGDIYEATHLYILEVEFPDGDAGWSETYIVDDVYREFSGYKAFKIMLLDEDYAQIWMPSPEGGELINLTPEHIFMPNYVNPDGDNYEEGLGHWNSNLFMMEPGTFYIVFVRISDTNYIAAIPIE